MNWRDWNYLQHEYVEKERSTSDIAKEHGVYPTTVRRELKKQGFEIRDKSEAQRINIKKNGAPVQGRKRTKAEKEKISAGLQKFWDDLSEPEFKAMKEMRATVAKEKWASMSKKERNENIKKMHLASKDKMYSGSKNENLLAKILSERGYEIVQRTNEYTPGRRFEIDIAIPSERVAIEWDGATHFQPIYGDEHLAKVQEKDHRKNMVLVMSGWTVIRCHDYSTASTMAFCNRAADAVEDIIKGGEKEAVHIVEAR